MRLQGVLIQKQRLSGRVQRGVNGGPYVDKASFAAYKAEQLVVNGEQDGFLAASTAPVYKRVSGGVQVLTQPFAPRMAIQPAFYWDADLGRLTIYCVMSNHDPNVDLSEYTPRISMIRVINNENDPHELTVDDTAYIKDFSASAQGKFANAVNVNFSTVVTNIDFRLLCRLYDAHGELVSFFYSEQYRYYLESGVMKRERFDGAAPQAGNIVTDFGIRSFNSTVRSLQLHRFYELDDGEHDDFIPFDGREGVGIHDFDYVIPDAFWSGRTMANIGVRTGGGVVYYGPTIINEFIAAENIASGDYFEAFGGLFRATASIASGAAIVPGTNCTELRWTDVIPEQI